MKNSLPPTAMSIFPFPLLMERELSPDVSMLRSGTVLKVLKQPGTSRSEAWASTGVEAAANQIQSHQCAPC